MASSIRKCIKNDQTHWKYYPWDLVTTIAITEDLDDEFFCKSHEKKVRVVYVVDYPVSQLSNITHRHQWIRSLLEKAKNTYTDGVNIDMESVIEDEVQKDLLTALVFETNLAFHLSIPGSQVTFDVAWSPDCIDGRCYDYRGLSEACDFLFVMAYDLRSQIFGPCIASANSPFLSVMAGITDFTNLGISRNKLVLGVPWYGYDYTCIQPQNETVCPIASVPFRGVNCSDAAGSQYDYYIIQQLLKHNSTHGRQWNDYFKSPYFSYRSSNGELHQVWYDDPESLTFKYGAAKQLGLKGVGMWTSDFLDYENQPRESDAMWNAIRKFF